VDHCRKRVFVLTTLINERYGDVSTVMLPSGWQGGKIESPAMKMLWCWRCKTVPVSAFFNSLPRHV